VLKKLVFMILLHLRKRQQKTAASKSGGPGYGIKSCSSIEEMEHVQPLCDDEMVRVATKLLQATDVMSLLNFVSPHYVFHYNAECILTF